MPSDYPPLPTPNEGRLESGNVGNESISVPKALPTRQRLRAKDAILVPESTSTAPNLISPNGDIILEYAAMSSEKKHYWRVSSEKLMTGSPYFGAMLDSEKFMEGRLLAQQRQALIDGAADSSSSILSVSSLTKLPIVEIPCSTKSELCGVEAIQLFLKILCLDSSDTEAQDIFYDGLTAQSSSIVAKLIDISEWFNSISPVQKALQTAQYRGGGKSKPGVSMKAFTLDMLKLKERRIREMIFISASIGLNDILKAMTHTLILVGSRYWQQGPERPTTDGYLSWKYLPNGLEEEIYHRRQCVMNTLTDLQAHFLRAYGGLERDEPNAKPNTPGVAFSSSFRNPELQCRNGLDNGAQCDIFHLGQMTRFFALRTKTIFLGSTLVDPNFNKDDSDEQSPEQYNGPNEYGDSEEPQFAINQVIAGLKQYPDYQIDANHVGCGIRRRILPILDGIEKFTADSRGLLGIQASLWELPETRMVSAWSGKGGPKDHTVEIRFAKITKIDIPSYGPLKHFTSPEDQARFMFTAAKYKWEA